MKRFRMKENTMKAKYIQYCIRVFNKRSEEEEEEEEEEETKQRFR